MRRCDGCGTDLELKEERNRYREALEQAVKRLTEADECAAYGDDYEAEVRAVRDDLRQALADQEQER